MKKSGILGAPEDLPIFGTYRFRLIKRGAYTAAEMNSQLVDLGDFTAPPHVWRAVRYPNPRKLSFFKVVITFPEYVRTLPTNNPRRRACADLSAHQLQHRTESEGSCHSLQFGKSGTIARRTAVGINSLLGKRPEDCLPDHQRPS